MDFYKILIIFIVLNTLIVLLFDKIKFFHYAIDYPDTKRKFHKKPTSLAGGTILMMNLILYLIFVFFYENLLDKNLFNTLNEFIIFLITCSLIYTVGIYDDKYNLNPFKKFLLISIIIILFINIDILTQINNLNFSFHKKIIFMGNYSVIFTLFCYIVFMNAFNMFDGINLQSSSYSLIILISIIFIYNLNLFILILIIYFLFFSYLNINNKSFLGDNGTLLLSFIISFIFIKLYNQKIFEFSDEVVLFMLVPGIDLIRLVIERTYNKKNPLSFDRNHIHHLLLNKFSYLKSIIFLNLLIIFPIILSIFINNNFIIIFIFIILYSAIILKLKY